MSEVIVLYDGYSYMNGTYEMLANCSCVLIKGPKNVIVDTMTPWDKNKILTALAKHGIDPDDIHFVVSTHGHSDHIGNNNLFLKATHIVGFSISFEDKYYIHPFDKGVNYTIDSNITVIPTAGHTLTDVTVHVIDHEGQNIAIAGDLFEREEDIENPNIWLEAGSEDAAQQSKNRLKISEISDWIVPGHGTKFQVTPLVRKRLEEQIGEAFLKK